MAAFGYTIKLPSRVQVFKLWFIGDLHLGCPDFEETRFKETVEKIRKDKYAWWFGMGDYCEFISFRDPRFDPTQLSSDTRVEDLRDLARFQYGRFIELVRPIQHKCIVLLNGNHEEQWTKHYHYDIGWYICDRMKVQHGSYACFVRLFICDKTQEKSRYHIDVYANHGYGGARTTSADLTKVKKMADDKDVDIVAMGHGHKLASDVCPRVGLIGNRESDIKYQERPMVTVLTGSYKKTYNPDSTNYTEMKAYNAVQLGSPCVEVKRYDNRGAEDYSQTKTEFKVTI